MNYQQALKYIKGHSTLEQYKNGFNKYGSLQENFLEKNFKIEDLPLPFSVNPKEYDGNVFLANFVYDTLKNSPSIEYLPSFEEYILAISTNGLNDYWLDETGWHGRIRNYSLAIEAWDGINSLCYSYLNHKDFDLSLISNKEIRNLIDYYKTVIEKVNPKIKNVVVQHLLAVNLYQGLTLFQEKQYIDKYCDDEIKRNYKDLDLQKRIQVEKSGFVCLSFGMFFPTKFDMKESLPKSQPSLLENYTNFVKGIPIYPTDGFVGFCLKAAGIFQSVDDLEDVFYDDAWDVVSPETLRIKDLKDLENTSKTLITEVANDLSNKEALVHTSEERSLYDSTVGMICTLTDYRSQRMLVRERNTQIR